MDASAFASLVYLAEVLEIVKRRSISGLPPRLDEQQIDDFRVKVLSLQKFLEDLSPEEWRKFEDGISKIVDVVFDVKNAIDAHVVDQTMGAGDKEMNGGLSGFLEDLSSVLEEMETIKRELEAGSGFLWNLKKSFQYLVQALYKIFRRVRWIYPPQQAGVVGLEKQHGLRAEFKTMAVNKDPQATSDETTPPIQVDVVGNKQHMDQLKEQLTDNDKKLKVVAIVGMAGIGKTTLARYLYEDHCFDNRFDRRVWCTVTVKNVALLLQKLGDNTDSDDIPQLGAKLHNELHRHRYLVVVDDVWSIDAWKKLKLHFPDEENGSRIIVTTREERIINTLPSSHLFKMEFLDGEQSWELLRQKVFGLGTNCPSHLVEIGKEIANSCMGLPLSIVAVAGLLSKSNMTLDYWSYVARNVSSLVSRKDDGQCLKILSFSYENMPLHLKPCFLYLVRYKDDKIIRADSLMKDWICSGIVKPMDGKTMCETAREYLKDLIDRNLVLVEEKDEFLKDPIICRIHDLMLELCVNKSEGYRKIIINPSGYCWRGFMYSDCLHVSIDAFWMGRDSSGCHGSIIHQVRRLDIYDVPGKCPRCNGQWQLVTCSKSQPTYSPRSCASNSTVSHFHGNNQAIIPFRKSHVNIDGPEALCLPLRVFWNVLLLTERDENRSNCQSMIWDMPQLQTYSTEGVLVPMKLQKPMIFEKLWKLESRRMECTKEMVEGIPNLKSLHVTYDYNEDLSGHCLENMECWGQLQELCITRVQLDSANLRYPMALVVLEFQDCSLSSTHTSLLATMLPNLKRLILHYCLVYEWNLEGILFKGLEYLQITNTNRKYHQRWRWSGGQSNFPNLKILAIEEDYLEKIPLDMGKICTLELIIARRCCDRVRKSAERIIKIQREIGNETLQLHIYEGPFNSAATYRVFKLNENGVEEQEEEEEEEEEELCIFRDITNSAAMSKFNENDVEEEEEDPGYPAGGYPPQYQQPPPQQQQKQSGGVGFMEGCLAALCCCCVLDEEKEEEGEQELCIFRDITVFSRVKVLRFVESSFDHRHIKLIGGTSFPNLKRLILESCIIKNYQDFHWRMGDVEFQGLQHLQIIDLDFGIDAHRWEWSAKASNFPKLETIEIINGYHLKGIPLDLGNIATLVSIRVECCSHEVVESAKEIFRRKEKGTFKLLIGSFKSVSGKVEDVAFNHEEGNEEDNSVWEGYLDIKLLAVDPQQFNSREELLDHLFSYWILIDDGRMSFSLDRATEKKCFMISARGLHISWGNDKKYWVWESNTKSRFRKVARLVQVCWLNVIGTIQLNMLTPSTTYAAYLVFSLANNAWGLHTHSIQGEVIINNEKHETRLVSLLNPDREEDEPLNNAEKPRLREDGWMEVKLGQGFVEGGEGVFEAKFSEIKKLYWKQGLIIEGIEIRPILI